MRLSAHRTLDRNTVIDNRTLRFPVIYILRPSSYDLTTWESTHTKYSYVFLDNNTHQYTILTPVCTIVSNSYFPMLVRTTWRGLDAERSSSGQGLDAQDLQLRTSAGPGSVLSYHTGACQLHGKHFTIHDLMAAVVEYKHIPSKVMSIQWNDPK